MLHGIAAQCTTGHPWWKVHDAPLGNLPGHQPQGLDLVRGRDPSVEGGGEREHCEGAAGWWISLRKQWAYRSDTMEHTEVDPTPTPTLVFGENAY